MLDILLGATMATLAGATGYLAGRYRPRPGPPEMPKAICPCDHPISFHADLTGQCSGTVAVAIKWNAYGEERAWRQDPCPCGHYTGPELISPITMRQITTEQ